MARRCEWDVASGENMTVWTLWTGLTARTVQTGELDQTTKAVLELMAKRHGNRQAAEILEGQCR